MAEKKTAKLQTKTPAKKPVTNKVRQTGKTKVRKPKKGLNRRTALITCLLYTSPSPRDRQKSRMPSSA